MLPSAVRERRVRGLQRLRWVVGAVALVACAQVGTIPPSPDRAVGSPHIVAEVNGEIARVLLVRAWRFDSDATRRFHTPSGVGFEFVVLRSSRASGKPTVKRNPQVTVDGRDYAEMSREAASKAKPSTLPIYEAGVPLVGADYPTGLRLADGRRASDAFGLRGDEAFVLKLMMAGAELGAAREVAARIEVGWDGWTEPVVVSVPVGELRSGPVSY